jgi:D-threo-aldose 1-dehydrogenase
MSGTASSRRRLGATSLDVSPLCIGGAPLGSMPGNFGYEVDEVRAGAALDAIFASPVNFLDTSNSYSHGESERRIGAAIARHGGLPPGFVLSTKADRDPETGSFTADRVRRSAQESLSRLGINHFPLLFLHDPEHIGFDAAMQPGGAVEGLIALRDEGLVDWTGVAGGPIEMLRSFAGTGLFDVILTHNRFTLADRSAEPLFDEAAARGIGILNAAPYGGGILSKGPSHTRQYAYRDAPEEMLRRIGTMEERCRRAGVTLATAALQWSMRDARITSTVVGTADPCNVSALVEMADAVVPDHLWDELEALTPPSDTWLH